jgi:hypothetical protein
MQPMRDTQSQNIRGSSVEHLTMHLGEAIHLHSQVKQANSSGRELGFIAIYELFDKVSADVENYSDLIAERAWFAPHVFGSCDDPGVRAPRPAAGGDPQVLPIPASDVPHSIALVASGISSTTAR